MRELLRKVIHAMRAQHPICRGCRLPIRSHEERVQVVPGVYWHEECWKRRTL